MRKYTIKFSIFSVILILTISPLWATHIRAGEITARRIDNLTLTYEFTFVGYRDTKSGITFGSGIFDFGDGNFEERNFRITEVTVAPNIVRANFTLIHTFQSPRTYIVSYREDFRNDGISNMDNSVNTSFYVETMIVIDPFFGLNSSPIMTVPPIDEGTPGVVFIHNPGAFDEDGDSLSYYFTIPKQSKITDVLNYRPLNTPAFYTSFSTASEAGEPATLILKEDGSLIWDTPGDVYRLSGSDCPSGVQNCSEYNVAFVVEEWRFLLGDWYRLGYVTRDMQIIIYEGDNEKPSLEVPDPLCVTAGEQAQALIIGTDPDGHAVKLEAFGGPFEISSPAVYSPSPPVFQNSPGELQFIWQTVCGHVRQRPYEVQFKVSDNPFENNLRVGPTLVDFETLEITVVGPQPQGLTSNTASGRSIQLNWSEYSCPNASEMQIWRKVGESEIVLDSCNTGIPEGIGYSLVGVVPISTTSFLDTKLSPGANYCYRLVAVFPEPGNGLSFVSEESCLTLNSDAPVIVQADIVSATTQGSIQVAWVGPIDIDPAQFPPPYTYSVYRSESSNFLAQTVIAQGITDTLLLDNPINTQVRRYFYRIAFYDNTGEFVDSSAVASTARLEAQAGFQSISLQWNAVVPWSLFSSDYPIHYIFRDNVRASEPEAMVLIDSVNVLLGGTQYLDDGRFNLQLLDEELEYCYRITTVGSYDNPLLPEPLLNRTQIVCAQPNDNIAPCSPTQVRSDGIGTCEEVLSQFSCDFISLEHRISWQPDENPICDEDITYYRIFFSLSGLEEDYILLDSVPSTDYIRSGLSNYKGCYRIVAVDRSFNSSEPSEPICFDNCPQYFLPNVFTPNGDGFNDLYMPIYSGERNLVANFDNSLCPRFIKSVEFTVFDRTGKNVFSFQSSNSQDILIEWDGKSTLGISLPTGVYFYQAKINYDKLDASGASENISGWIQLLK